MVEIIPRGNNSLAGYITGEHSGKGIDSSWNIEDRNTEEGEVMRSNG